MSVSILEALQNADYNLDNAMKMPMLLPLVKEQLHNATTLLDKGYDIWTEVEPLLEKYESVENVPEFKDNKDINQDEELSSDNEIFVKAVKTNWTRVEVEELLHRAVNDSHCRPIRVKQPNSNACAKFTNKWINENL